MPSRPQVSPNALGDLRAEADTMLDRAFLETADYRTLIETSDRVIVVGRRGTGKSALTLKLQRYWDNAEGTEVLKLVPEEHQVIGIRPLIQLFGDTFLRVRAGTRLVWRYALMMETARCLSTHHSFTKCGSFAVLDGHLQAWNKLGFGTVERFRKLMKITIDVAQSPEERIAELPIKLNLSAVESALADCCSKSSTTMVLLVDKLDEGYELDEVGVGFIDGLVQAVIDLKTRIPRVRPVVFLRDNIYRAVQARDQDFSRNIEGQVLRLHWDERALLDFAAKRLAIAFGVDAESSQKIWNYCTAGELRSPAGFVRCLQLTLYRPRDLLALLNDALYAASRNKHTHITIESLESTARTISQNRLDDLRKEYSGILPGLPLYIGAFHGHDPELEVIQASALIEKILTSGSTDSLIQQDFLILEDAQAVIRGLYSVGFLGVKDASTGNFVFCHDGRAPDRNFAYGDKVLVHPCYWMALNSTKNTLDPQQAEGIYDEYDIEVSSETPEIRNDKITKLIRDLELIPEGAEGDAAFEVWCHKAIRICFAKGLRNVELKANKLARQRRDVIATNLGEDGVWKRIYQDYGTRQVTFEVKNYRGLSASDYQQIQSYLAGDYGRLAFAVTRDDSVDLLKHRDVDWVREMYAMHKVLIVKLTGKYFARLLYKLRNPQRHDDVDNALHKLLDTYTRLYLAGQTKTEAKYEKRKKRREGKAKNVEAETQRANER